MKEALKDGAGACLMEKGEAEGRTYQAEQTAGSLLMIKKMPFPQDR